MADYIWSSVETLQSEGALLVEDGNHGEYRPRREEFAAQGVAFVRAADIDQGRVDFSQCEHINEVARARIRKGIGQPLDILLSHKGTVGKLAVVGEDAPPFVCSPQTTFWRVLDADRIDRRYLYAFMNSQAFTSQLRSVQGETDMAPYVSLTAQRRLRVPLPSLRQQNAVGSILGAIGEKIDLNRRMNETLEELARAFFKSWFVDFDPVRAKASNGLTGLGEGTASLFPSQLDLVSGGEVPKGWSLKSLSSCGRFLNGLALQKYPAGGDDFLPVIKIAELRAGRWSDGDRANISVPADYLVDDGDLLFSWSGSLIHRIWCGGRGALNQHLFKVTSDTTPRWFLFEAIQQHMAEFRAIAADKATTMGHIQRRHLDEALVAVAPPPVMQAADAIMAPLFERMLLARKQTRTLVALRDLLLPQLMSGAIHVRDAEHQLTANL